MLSPTTFCASSVKNFENDNQLHAAATPTPCVFPGLPYPPGCDDGSAPTERPALQPAPAEVNPPVADPDLDKAYGLAKIGATDAWKTHKGSKDMLVAVIDTVPIHNHEDLSFNMWRNPTPSDKNDVVGFDFVHNDGLPYDDNEHETHTSGTIGAVGGNGKGVSGVNQRVSIMAVKFLSGEGSGTTADAVRAIDYAVDHGAKVLSKAGAAKATTATRLSVTRSIAHAPRACSLSPPPAMTALTMMAAAHPIRLRSSMTTCSRLLQRTPTTSSRFFF